MNEIPLILVNANNEIHFPVNSNYILNNYDFNEAINYDERKFWRIFFIYLKSWLFCNGYFFHKIII